MFRVAKRLWALLCLGSAAAQAQQVDTIRLAVRWEIREGTHAVAESLGVLSGIAVDRVGTVYVSDRGATRIWVFDSLGRSQRGIGRKGKGPGEFESPTGIVVGPDGRLWVRDIVRVTRFAPDPESGRLTRYESNFDGPMMADWMSNIASRFTSDGAFYYPAFGVYSRTITGRFLILAADGAQRDSIIVPLFPDGPELGAWVRTSANGGRMLPGLNHVPFAAVPVYDVTPRRTLLAGDGKSYVIREVDRGGRLVREFRRTVLPERIPAAERRDSIDALRARLDSLRWPRERIEGVPPDVWALKVPETYPPYMAVYAGLDGRIWVRRWIANGDRRSVFDVFEPDGRLRAVVELPRAILTLPTPVLTLDGIAAIGVDRETGAHTILRFGRARPR